MAQHRGVQLKQRLMRSLFVPSWERVGAVCCLVVMLFTVITIYRTRAVAEPAAVPAEESAEIIGEELPTAQATNLHQWGAVSLFHGLPSDTVRAVAQDPDGTMWFGTDEGLARYDGRRTERVKADGLLGKRVLALEFDSSGALWVGTDQGAARFASGRWSSVEGTERQVVSAISTPTPERIVLAGGGVIFDCRKRPDDSLDVRTIRDHPLLSIRKGDQQLPLEITSLAVRGELLVIGTRGRGLLIVEAGTPREVRNRPRTFFVEAIDTNKDGELWFGAQTTNADSGLYQARDFQRPTKVGTGIGTVTALCHDESGSLWVGTDGQGAMRYRGSQQVERFTFQGTAGGLRSDTVYAMFVDREGVVWFGTNRGVCRYDPHGPRHETLSADPQSNFIRALYQARDGRIWCGANRGLFVFGRDQIVRPSFAAAIADAAVTDPIADSVAHPSADFARRTIYTIAEDHNQRLLIGTSTGLYVASLNAQPPAVEEAAEPPGDDAAEQAGAQAVQERPTGESVRAIRVFQGRSYIAVFGRGLYKLGQRDGAARKFVWPADSKNTARQREVISLHADGSNRLWIGTARAGVFVFDGQRVVPALGLEKLAGSAVWAMDGTSDGVLWLATASGLYAQRSGQLIAVAPGFDVRGVVADQNHAHASLAAWCVTAGGGLVRVSFDDQFGWLISQLSVEQGLPSQNAFALLQTSSDNGGDQSLVIGTSRGLVRYQPGRIRPVLSPTRILSQRLYQPDELRATLDLPYPQNSLALDAAAASSRTFPEQFLYGFLLRDSAGRVVRNKLARDQQFLIENLPPGRYRVEARAFTKDLLSSEPFAFEFSVARAPFPWTIAALSVLLMLALVALWWGAMQNRRIARTSTALARVNYDLAGARLELANEAERERRRIARDLHDQTLADLRQLLLLADELPTKENGNNLSALNAPVLRAKIESVSHEVRRICEDLSPSVLENIGLIAALEWALADQVAHLPASQKFGYEFVCSEAAEQAAEKKLSHAEIHIYRIVQEAISNVCRHAAATHVRLTSDVTSSGDLLITLEDNGRGFDTHSRKTGQERGLADIRARASLIEAHVEWTKLSGGGTRFTLCKAGIIKDTVTL